MLDLNSATFVGIDVHTREHTALAIDRFEDKKGEIRFDNTRKDITKALSWIQRIESDPERVVVGVEGGSWERNALLRALTQNYPNVYEVNPLFTKQRRTFGTKGDKSDSIDAKLIAEVLTKKLNKLPRITKESLTVTKALLKRFVWYYNQVVKQSTRIKNQLKPLERERKLALDKRERKGLALIIKLKKKELIRLKRRKKELTGELEELVDELDSNLTTMPGISTVLAAKIIAYTKDIKRFKKPDQFVSYAGIAPQEMSSGKSKRYIKVKKGNRKLNSAFYLVALSQICWNPRAKAYLDKKVAEGKTKKHAIRCLTRKIACIVYAMMKSGEKYRGPVVN